MADTALVVFNPGDSPVGVDADGHIVGGAEYLPVRRTDEVRDALKSGRLVEVRDPGENARLSPAAKEAFKTLRADLDKRHRRSTRAKSSSDQGGKADPNKEA